MRPVCVKCEREYVTKKQGVTLVEVLKDGDPYKMFNADLMACPRCADRIVVTSQSAMGTDIRANKECYESIVRAGIDRMVYFAREFFTKGSNDAS